MTKTEVFYSLGLITWGIMSAHIVPLRHNIPDDKCQSSSWSWRHRSWSKILRCDHLVSKSLWPLSELGCVKKQEVWWIMSHGKYKDQLSISIGGIVGRYVWLCAKERSLAFRVSCCEWVNVQCPVCLSLRDWSWLVMRLGVYNNSRVSSTKMIWLIDVSDIVLK